MAEEENKAIRTAATVGTSPLWVPVAAAGGIIYGAGKGIDKANTFGKKHGPLAGIAATPFIVIGNALAGPFQGIKKCEMNGGYLMDITTQEEQNFIEEHLETDALTDHSSYWTGSKRVGFQFQWQDGTNAGNSYSNWSPGELLRVASASWLNMNTNRTTNHVTACVI